MYPFKTLKLSLMDSEYSGHFGRFKDKSNKIRYKANEIHAVRLELEKI